MQSVSITTQLERTAMSSVLHFSPAFKPSLLLSTLTSSSRKSSKKRRRDHEPSDEEGDDGDDEGSEADSAGNGSTPPSNVIIATPLAAPGVENSHGVNVLHSQSVNRTDLQGLHTSKVSRSFPHRITETAPSLIRGQISGELATLNPPLNVAAGGLLAATADNMSGSMGLRQHHINTITAVLHKCLSECDYIRAGRAWAMFIRAEQHGQSMNLRTHDRWGVGAEILMQHEVQTMQKPLDDRIFKTSNPPSNLRVKPESIEKVKEYYERVLLQYPYRKAFPNATGALNFSVAMFSLWVYAVKERSSMALIAVSSSNEITDETGAQANGNVQRSSASHIESDRYQRREQVKRDAFRDAHEIATQLNGLLASPPCSDNAKLWKLYGEISLWIADLSVAAAFSKHGSNISGDDEDLTVERSSLSKGYRAGQERQIALANAEEAFQRVKICGERSAL